MIKLIKIFLTSSPTSHFIAFRGLLPRGVALIFIGTIFSAQAAPTDQAAKFSGGENGISLSQLPSNFLSMRVTGPDGLVVETKNNYLQAPRGEWMPDGQYSFEMLGQVSIADEFDKRNFSQKKALSKSYVKQESNQISFNGRNEKQLLARSQSATKVLQSGYFRIKNGQVIVENSAVRESNHVPDNKRKVIVNSDRMNKPDPDYILNYRKKVIINSKQEMNQ